MSKLSSRIALLCLTAITVGTRAQVASVRPQGYVLVTNKLDMSLSMIDPAAATEVAKIPVNDIDPNEDRDAVPHETAVSPDGKTAWTPVYSSSGMGGEGADGRSVTIIDLQQKKAIGFVDFGKPMRPHTPIFGPDGLLYVTTEMDNSVTIIDPKDRKVIGRIPTGGTPHFIAIPKAGKKLYVIKDGSVIVIDLKTRQPIATIPVTDDIMRLALTPDDRYLFTSDQSKPRIAVIDTAQNKVVRWIETPGLPYALTVSPDGKWLLFGIPMLGKLGVVDLSSFQVTHTVEVLRIPFQMFFRPDSQEAYVATGASKALGIIDVKDWKVRAYVRVGLIADHVTWAPGQN